MMKTITIFTLLCFTLLGAFVSQAQIPNAGFESWSTVSKEGISYHELTDWYTPNAISVFGGEPEMAVQTTDAYEGSSALKLSNIANRNNMSANAFTMKELAKDDVTDKFPVTGKIMALKGFYKYDYTAVNDSCSISVLLFRNGMNIGFGEFVNGTKQSTYTPFMASIQYFTDSLPDSASITIFTSRNDFQLGSVLSVDAFSFATTSTAMLEGEKPEVKASVYPNPVYGIAGVTFEQTQPGRTGIAVYNVLGTLVQQLSDNEYFDAGKHNVDWDTADLPEGIYFVKITRNTTEKTIKVLLK